MYLLEIRLSLSGHIVVGGVVSAAAGLGLVGEGHVFMVSLRNGCICVVSGCLHKLMLRVKDVDVFKMLTRLLKQNLLPLRSTTREILMLRNLTLCFVPIFKMRLGPHH